jgi:hypothetical protein
VSSNRFDLRAHYKDKNLEELLDWLATSGAQPGSAVHMAVTTAIQVRIAEIQRDVAHDALQLAKIQTAGTVGATVIALVALLVAAL